MGWSSSVPIGVTFPLQDPSGSPCGIHVRTMDGTKTCIRGSALGSGLFVPLRLDPSRQLFLAEGCSDCAALLSIGLEAVGRPSTSTRPEVVRRFLQAQGFLEIVVVADNDRHGAGQAAATALAKYLRHFVDAVQLLIPPTKDVRQWVQQGADRATVLKGLTRVD
jgi:phage/plasmid primase-like uncharacterized protein